MEINKEIELTAVNHLCYESKRRPAGRKGVSSLATMTASEHDFPRRNTTPTLNALIVVFRVWKETIKAVLHANIQTFENFKPSFVTIILSQNFEVIVMY